MGSLLSPVVSMVIQGNIQSSDPAVQGALSLNDAYTGQPTVGTGQGKIDKLYRATRAVTSGTPDTIDCTSALVDAFGSSISAVSVGAIKITNNSQTAGQILTIGGGTNALFATMPLTIPPGASFCWSDTSSNGVGLTIASTTKIIQTSVASGSAVPYTISLLTRSA